MKCGNCKDDHATVRDVQSCYAGQPQEPTAGQVNYLRDLWAKKARHDQPFENWVEGSKQEGTWSRQAVSQMIDDLSHMSDREGLHDDDTLFDTGHAGIDVTITTVTVPDGIYTVVHTEGDRVTLRFRDAAWAKDLPTGSQVVEFLSGPDNESSYTGFAFVVKGKARVWKRYKTNASAPVTALAFMLTATDQQVQEAGYAYALESSRCYRCNRTLTVPASIHRGLGPVCAGVLAHA